MTENSERLTVELKLDPVLKEQLHHAASASHLTDESFVLQAVQAHIELTEWQLTETHTALAEAEKGDFAPAEDVSKLFKHWCVDAD